ncbi:hypothetical protein ACFXAZ_12110 [Streptomyces sp. NPDC059477]|uniref:hypothetical protein n=1 Tax=Streptomyces sp. NPDC059477 TaxID=3346847 RepID=UPI0036CE6693
MADHSPRPDAPATSPALAALHAQCREDYALGQAQRATAQPLPAYTAFTDTPAPAIHHPLFDPDMDMGDLPPLSLDGELRLARRLLDETEGANIHDPQAMIRAATALHMRLRSIAVAITAERGGA